MTVIEAAAMRCKTMSDGSLRIEVEIEPTNAQTAFALFGKPGAPIALAALVPGYAAKSDEEEEEQPQQQPPRRSGGDGGKPIARWLALRCREPEFQRWLQARVGAIDATEDLAAEWCRDLCGVQSRGDIDDNAEAERLFRERIQGPWSLHYQARHG